MTGSQTIDRLAGILRALDEASQNPAALEGLLTALCEPPDSLFAGAVVLKGGYSGRSFVVVSLRGYEARAARSWMRWPLRRLFTRMKPSIIAAPTDGGSVAMALPFTYGAQRYLVIAPLTEARAIDDHAGFFAALESVTIPQGALAPPLAEHIPITPSDPLIVGFALCDDLHDRIAGPLQRRGWNIERLSSFVALSTMLKDSRPDVVAIDTFELANPFAAAASIHRLADSAALRLAAFGELRAENAQSLPIIDRLLPHHAASDEIFRAFKRLVTEASNSRRLHADELDAAAADEARAMLTPQELVDFGAYRAAELMQGWACVILENQYGAVYRAEHAHWGARQILRTVPRSFLNDTPIFCVRVDDAFIDEITDLPDEAAALIELEPLSGASIPLALGGSRRGVLVACSQRRWADSRMFDALNRLADAIARRFATLQPHRGFIPEFRQERMWERLRDRAFGVDIYRSSDCVTPWRYRMLDDSNGLLTLGLEDDTPLVACARDAGRWSDNALAEALEAFSTPCFAAKIDFSLPAMNYATLGFSPPVVLSSKSPTGSIGMSGRMMLGMARLSPPSRALICDSSLWRWYSGLEKRRETLPELLDRESPPGLASIVTMS
jgi:hypothetical protein